MQTVYATERRRKTGRVLIALFFALQDKPTTLFPRVFPKVLRGNSSIFTRAAMIVKVITYEGLLVVM